MNYLVSPLWYRSWARSPLFRDILELVQPRMLTIVASASKIVVYPFLVLVAHTKLGVSLRHEEGNVQAHLQSTSFLENQVDTTINLVVTIWEDCALQGSALYLVSDM